MVPEVSLPKSWKAILAWGAAPLQSLQSLCRPAEASLVAEDLGQGGRPALCTGDQLASTGRQHETGCSQHAEWGSSFQRSSLLTIIPAAPACSSGRVALDTAHTSHLQPGTLAISHQDCLPGPHESGWPKSCPHKSFTAPNHDNLIPRLQARPTRGKIAHDAARAEGAQPEPSALTSHLLRLHAWPT